MLHLVNSLSGDGRIADSPIVDLTTYCWSYVDPPSIYLQSIVNIAPPIVDDGGAHITVVTFLHKRVFRPKALVVFWRKPRGKKALEHMAHGLVWWLCAMTHAGERISIIKSTKQERDGRTFKDAWILTIRPKWKSQKGSGESWEGTWMRQRRVQDIPSQQSLILRK